MFSRWLIYINEMYPPLSRLIFSIVFASSVLVAQDRFSDIRFSWPTFFMSSLFMFCYLLFYRIFDEFKDYEVDLKFFPHRPLPSGKVFKNDLLILGAILIGLSFGVQLVFFFHSWCSLLLLFIFTVLMMKNFFAWNLIANNRLLAFFTHSPITFLLVFNILNLRNFAETNITTFDLLLILVWHYIPGCVFEFCRKTRSPNEEVETYQTYSTILGPRQSISVAIFFIFLQLCLAPFYLIHGSYFPILFPAFILVILFLIKDLFRFWLDPRMGSQKLLSIAERYALVTIGLPLIGFIF